MTAAELRAALGSAGYHVDEPTVHRLLHSAHGRFRCEGGGAARWWPAAARRPTIPARTGRDRAAEREGRALAVRLHAWQAEALEAWERRGRRGVVEAVTGTGKTMVGVAAIAEQRANRGQALVLVPTKELQRQWMDVLRTSLPLGTLIGGLGDGTSASLVSHDVVVAVVNSLRSRDARPIRPHGLLVADECHRYASTFNRLALDPRFDRRLGLSATYARDDHEHRTALDPYFGGSCYQLGYRRAIADGVAAPVVVALIAVRFEPVEHDQYAMLTDLMRATAARLVERHGVPREPFPAFVAALNRLADSARQSEAAGLARRYRTAAAERRRLLADATGKLRALGALAPAVHAAARTIVFTQSVPASEQAAACLADRGIAAAAVHSRLHACVRGEVVERFCAGELQAVCAPRVLDEGVDVPVADLAVILGASRSRRQMVQRMGRVLRPKLDGRVARFVVLFVEGTVEDPASGAHEGFLSEITGVARAVRRFDITGRAGDVHAFLATTASDVR